MKNFLLLPLLALLLNTQTGFSQIPNNDFEIWNPSAWSEDQLQDWTSFYSELLPAMILKDSDSYSGTYSMRMYNGVFPSYAFTKFPVAQKPVTLYAFVKGNVDAGDSIYIRVVLYKQSVAVDSGRWVGHVGFGAFTQVNVSISKNSSVADSALVYVSGGTHATTEIKVDLMTLDFESGIPPEPTYSYLSASPNPFTNEVRLHVYLTGSFKGEIAMINVLGDEVITLPYSLAKGESEIVLNTHSLPSGSYWCLLRSGKELSRIRLNKVD